ncbi:MAG: CvpA family protein [Caulobacteraceae bacterium]
MTQFDMLAGAVLIVSGLIGLARGATREVTTVIAFVASAAIAVYGLRFTGPVARHFVATPWMANAVAILVIFIAAYILLRMIGSRLTQGVRRTALSGFDRALGFVIGLVRGLVVIGAALLLIDAATTPDHLPPWIARARLYPLANAASATLRAFAPQGFKTAHDVAEGAAKAVTDGGGQTDAERKSMDDLVQEKTR